MSRFVRIFSRVGIVAALAGVALGAHAYTSSITVTAGQAGQGSQPVCPYTAGSVHYVLDNTSTTTVDSVTFVLNQSTGATCTGTATAVTSVGSGLLEINLTDLTTAGYWYNTCTYSATNSDWSCDTSGTAVTLNQINNNDVLVAS